MQVHRVQIRFEDELPTIGSGVRRLYVEVGHKWVYLKRRPDDRRCRLLRTKYLALKPTPIKA